MSVNVIVSAKEAVCNADADIGRVVQAQLVVVPNNGR